MNGKRMFSFGLIFPKICALETHCLQKMLIGILSYWVARYKYWENSSWGCIEYIWILTLVLDFGRKRGGLGSLRGRSAERGAVVPAALIWEERMWVSEAFGMLNKIQRFLQ